MVLLKFICLRVLFGNIEDTTISRRDNSLLEKCMIERSPFLKHFIEETKIGFIELQFSNISLQELHKNP